MTDQERQLMQELRLRIEQLERRLRILPVTASSGGSVTHGNVTSPTTIGSSAEGLVAENAATWTWSSGGTPVEVWMQSRSAYFDAGDQKLYGYARKLTFDTQGFFYSIGAETRYIIDTPAP